MRARLRLKPIRIGIFSLMVVALLVPIIAVSGTGSGLWNRKGSHNQEVASVPSSRAAGGPHALDIAGPSENLDAVSFSPGLPTDSSSEPSTITKSEAWDNIDFNSRRLSNNVWGAPADEKMASGVFLAKNNSFGWYWNRHAPRAKPGINGILPIYPSVRVGGSPWESSNSVYFPVRLNEIKSWQCSFSYNYAKIPDGSYDLAYDMFLSDTNQPSPTPKRSAEVMIWIHQTLAPPADSYKGDFTDGNNNYGLYSYIMSDGRLYFSFIMKGQPLFSARHNVDIKKLLDLIDLNPKWYIHGIELGNEVVNGSGKIEISQFNVNLNGHDS